MRSVWDWANVSDNHYILYVCVHKVLACYIREYGHREEINGKKYNDKGKNVIVKLMRHRNDLEVNFKRV